MTETKEQILERMTDLMPWRLADQIKPYILEAMKIHADQQLILHGVGWRSEQLPEFDVQEINDILKKCKENKDDLLTLVSRIWNKGYMTGVCYDKEND